MLILSRNVRERVIILLPDGRRITVTLIDIRGSHSARLGFDADRDIQIHRDEVVARNEEKEE